jgi:hypothetical protein
MKDNIFKKVLNLVIEPIALGILALLFILPAITVINLQPLTKKLQEINVLGVSSDLQVNLIGGTHQIFNKENVEKEDNTFTYTTKLTKRDADTYSKPILEIVNRKEETVNIEIYGGTSLPTGSDISLIINDQKYRVQAPKGDVVTQRIQVVPKEKYIIYLYIENFSPVQFEQDFELKIKEVE